MRKSVMCGRILLAKILEKNYPCFFFYMATAFITFLDVNKTNQSGGSFLSTHYLIVTWM
jgi:surface polysaccharide O-acyltransferase-like enzyme